MNGAPVVSRSLFGWIAAGVALTLSLGCDAQPLESGPPANQVSAEVADVEPPRYAGSASCAACHQEIAERYSSHPMANSAGLADASMRVIEDFDPAKSEFSELGFGYRVERSADGEMVHQEQSPTESEVQYAQSFPVDFYVGSGERGRSYLIAKNDMLFQSPITWYSQAGRWDLSPGYHQNNRHFDRRVSGACVACHFGRPNPIEDAANRFQQPMFSEFAIGCENCHGAAADHVDWHNGKRAEGDQSSDPILAISKLEPAKQASICNQCHLVAADRVLREGKTAYDFRPGDNLEETWVCFVEPVSGRHDSQNAVSQVEQMRSSACFQKSTPQMQCTSCHDPHFSPTGAEAVSFYRQQCIACHNDASVQCSMPPAERLAVSKEDSCMQCHMPKALSSDVAHTSTTDHRVLRNYDQPPVADESAGATDFLHAFDDAALRLPSETIDRALLEIAAKHCIAEHDQHSALLLTPKIEAHLAKHPDDLSMYLHAGSLYHLTRDSRRAQEKLEYVLQRRPQDELALKTLFMLAHESNSLRAGIRYGREYLKINPWDADVTGRLIHLLGQTEEFEAAVVLARGAVERFPADLQIQAWLDRAEAFLQKQNASQK
ncbi:Doubled CXXCH motif (Paired_CXXCH_1) [Rosistilla oblonga]|uniref:Doubled CXXCH motif (Paired_CXXCH_1) n=2 Tax=Rosistilla oblonga TaxID=2527990 RepID=A0A518IWB7_9BACT|nr:Doubled CXXCH motif (Paired_CXXCH_1) [Rosistilla oblonga]